MKVLTLYGSLLRYRVAVMIILFMLLGAAWHRGLTAIEAPVLWVASRDRNSFHEFTRTASYRRRLAVIRRLQEVELADAGHMLHHDQPAAIAALIEDFFSR